MDSINQLVSAHLLQIYFLAFRTLIKRISEVTMDDLMQVGKYVWPLFDPKVARTVLVCHSSKVEEYTEKFTG